MTTIEIINPEIHGEDYKDLIHFLNERNFNWDSGTVKAGYAAALPIDKGSEGVEELLRKAHWHGWFVRERYTGPDRHGYEDKLPDNWQEMDYDEHEEWFCEQFIKKNCPTTDTDKEAVEGWISVKDRLPEIEDDVDVYMCKFADIKNVGASYIGFLTKDKKWTIADSVDGIIKDADNNSQYWEVTHWRERPAPPQQ